MSTVASILLVALFATAAIAKSLNLPAFRRYISPLARQHAATAATVVLLAEAVIAALWLGAAVEVTLRPIAGAVTAGTVIVATSLHMVVVGRSGETRCHCFGRPPGSERDESWSHLPTLAFRNALIVVVGLAMTASPAFAVLGGVSIPVIVAAGITNDIRRSRLLLRSDTHPLLKQYGANMPLLAAQTWWVNGHPRDF